MLSFKVIGCGAAGNKACIDLIENGFDKNRVTFLNSTSRDLPDGYKDGVLLFGNGLGGCGKERKLGKTMIIEDMKNETIEFDHILDPQDNAVVLVGSTEGGSGSATIPVLAKYFNEVHSMKVICILFFGFQDDVRGLQNSIELCQELSSDYTVIAISNAKYLEEANGNKFRAERKANEKFIELMYILSGEVIKPGVQVIDDTDLYKVVTTPGYMVADTYIFSRPKNIESFNNGLQSTIDSHKFIDPPKNPGAKRAAIAFDIPSDDDNIDYSAKLLDTNFGIPYEKFTNLHTGEEGTVVYKLYYIVSGMKMPSEELSAIYSSYIENSGKVDKTDDSFFDSVGQMRGNAEDSQFDVFNKKPVDVKKNKKSFFSSFDEGEKPNTKSSKPDSTASEEY